MYAVIGLTDPFDSLRGVNVLVMGLGLHGGGVDTAKWLLSQGARVLVTDIQTKKALATSVEKLKGSGALFVLGRHRYKDIRWADLIVASPGVPRESPYLRYAQKLSRPIENDASIFFARCKSSVIGITGTKGKTTTAVLTSSMLHLGLKRILAVGHHQVPLLSLLRRSSPHTTVIAELSSWRLERMANRAQSPHIAVITNVMPDHLNRYRNFTAYMNAKRSILDHQHANDHAILNRDNRITRSFGPYVRSHRWWFSNRPFPDENGAFIRKNVVYLRAQGKLRRIAVLPRGLWDGRHRREDLLAATLAAWLSGAPVKAISDVIANPPSIPHRMELVRTFRGVIFINDSAATTPEATIANLSTVHGPVVLIAGGSDKKLQYHSFARAIAQRTRSLVLFEGTASDKILKEPLLHSRVRTVKTMASAVDAALSVASRGTTVLLSPGAASFGIFKHEYDRGDQFRQVVLALR